MSFIEAYAMFMIPGLVILLILILLGANGKGPFDIKDDRFD